MTTWILQLPPVTLKRDEARWTNDEIRFTVQVPGAVFGTPSNEKFQCFRFENEGYEKFLFWKRSIVSFIKQAQLEHQPTQNFKYVERTLMGEAREEWTTLVSTMNANTSVQNDYLMVMCAYTKEHLPENPSQATLEYLREKAKLPDFLPIKDWIARIKTINSFLPLMQVDSNLRINKLDSDDLRDIIIKNLPQKYLIKISESNLPRSVGLNEIQQKLMVYELNFSKEKKSSERNKTKENVHKERKPNRFNKSKNKDKNFVNECRMHRGHEWADCESNPMNRKKQVEKKQLPLKEEANEVSKKKKKDKKKSEVKEEKHSIHRRKSRKHKSRRYYSSSGSSSDSSYSLYEIWEDKSDLSAFEDRNYFSVLNTDGDEELSISSFEVIEAEGKIDATLECFQVLSADEESSIEYFEEIMIDDIPLTEFHPTDVAEAFEQVKFPGDDEEFDISSQTTSDINSEMASIIAAIDEEKPTMRAEMLLSVPNHFGKTVFTALVDSGCSKSLLNRDIVRDTGTHKVRKSCQKWVTKAGEFITRGKAELEEFILPQFTHNRKIKHDFHLFKRHKNDRYDMILGRDLMQSFGLDILNSTQKFKWNGIEVDMVPTGHWSGGKKRKNVREFRATQEHNEVKKILESKYEKADLHEVVANLPHLTKDQQQALLAVFLQHEDLFLGEVGTWKGKPIDIQLKDNVKPYHAKAYRVPQAYLQTFKTEIDRLVSIGTLSPTVESEWASHTFCIPKKDDRIRIVSDFRILNTSIRRSPWPTPNIQEIFQEIGGFFYVTAIDLNMGYYAMALTERSKDLCTIVLPWSKYRYNSLPMGVCIATDVFQQRLSEIMASVPHIYVFIDDILIVGKGTYEEHLQQVDKVLTILLNYGMQVNPLKSFWAQSEVDYLGYVISKEGIRPQVKKVKAILDISPPTNKRQVRQFIGMVNYYRDMWQGRSHHLAPLTQLVGKNSQFVWKEPQQKAFDKLKAIISEETMLRFHRCFGLSAWQRDLSTGEAHSLLFSQVE